MAKLEDKKRKSHEAKEIIETIGAQGTKGAKAAQSYLGEKDRENSRAKEATKDLLDQYRQKKVTYTNFLGRVLTEYLDNIPWTLGWTYHTAITDEGIVLQITAPGPRYFAKGFKVTGDPTLDINAVENFVLQAENLFDKLTDDKGKTAGGIILPS